MQSNWPQVGGKKARWVTLDIRSALSQDYDCRVSEVGVVVVQGGVVVDEYAARINVGRDDLADDTTEQSPEQVWPHVMRLVHGLPIVTHDVHSVCMGLDAELDRLGLPHLTGNVHCTMSDWEQYDELAKVFWTIFGQDITEDYSVLTSSRAIAAIAPVLGTV
jgi:hypothetical protein